jgi:hypothetical protein
MGLGCFSKIKVTSGNTKELVHFDGHGILITVFISVFKSLYPVRKIIGTLDMETFYKPRLFGNKVLRDFVCQEQEHSSASDQCA